MPIKKRSKAREWIVRYGPAELVGTLTAYVGFFIGIGQESLVVASYAATLGENVGYYGTIIAREIQKDSHTARVNGSSYTFSKLTVTTIRLMSEFGPAEVLDSLVIRPFMIGFSSYLFGAYSGVLIGKLLADVLFYVPTILSYEIRKHLQK